MSFIGKEYTLVRQENYEEFLKSIGYSDDKIQKAAAFKHSQTVTKDGDIYTLKVKDYSGPIEVKFKSGEKFDDTIGSDKYTGLYVVDGNTMSQTLKFTTGDSAVIKKEYNGNELVETITASNWDGVCKCYYKA